jgi:hypothetical protein
LPALAATLAVVLLAYLAYAVPASWFASSPVTQWAVRDLTLRNGTGSTVNNELVVTGTDAAGQVYIAVVTDLRARDYATIAWSARGMPQDAEVHLLWRTDYAPNKIFSVPVVVEAGRLRPIVVASDAGWLGRITGIGLAVRGAIRQPFVISGVAAKPSSALGVLADRVGEWLAFERWSGASINTIVGGDDVQSLPLPLLLAVSVALAAAGMLAWRKFRPVPTASNIACGHRDHVRRIVVRARCAMDVEPGAAGPGDVRSVRWQGLARQASGRGRRRSVRVCEKARAELPATPARIFVASDRITSRTRGIPSLSAQRVCQSGRQRAAAAGTVQGRRLDSGLSKARRSVRSRQWKAALGWWCPGIGADKASRRGRRAVPHSSSPPCPASDCFSDCS